MDVRKILKVYNYVNDEKRPKVNVKFLAALAAFLVAGAALVTVALLNGGSSPSSSEVPASESKREYVGLSDQEMERMLSGRVNAQTAQQRWTAWQAEHPDAVVEKREEMRLSGVVVGWWVTWHDE